MKTRCKLCPWCWVVLGVVAGGAPFVLSDVSTLKWVELVVGVLILVHAFAAKGGSCCGGSSCGDESKTCGDEKMCSSCGKNPCTCGH